MAKRRDIVILVVLGLAFVFGMGLVGVFVLSSMGGGVAETDGWSSLSSGSVGLIEIYGVIDDNMALTTVKTLKRWSKAGNIKAVVLHINSPGGGVAASQEIFDAVRRVGENKPVVASLASVAASGGYYIACGADQIVANPGTLTGSIGVIFQFHTFQNLMDKVGIATETVKSGELKDVGNYSRSMTEHERTMMSGVVMDTYDQFVGVVAEGRGMTADEVYPLADGSLFTGRQAKEKGLVDNLGGLEDAINIAAQLAEIDEDPEIVRPYRRERVTVWDLMGGLLGKLPETLERSLSGPQLLYLYQ